MFEGFKVGLAVFGDDDDSWGQELVRDVFSCFLLGSLPDSARSTLQILHY